MRLAGSAMSLPVQSVERMNCRTRSARRWQLLATTQRSSPLACLRSAERQPITQLQMREYLESSPDWHVFIERGNHFASRRWSYEGRPKDTLHGYISEFGGDVPFQTRCLLCLDGVQWSKYNVQHVQEGTTPIKPKMSQGNGQPESRVMIECGNVWLELFEQSPARERRITKATIAVLEKEWSQFEQDPQAAIAEACVRSEQLASELADKDEHLLRLRNGFQPGIYEALYTLNAGEPGEVYLKAFEVTQGTQLSPNRLEDSSKTRMAWSEDASKRFRAIAGFTIYEGDWGQPYAARFEVWFVPDNGAPERKLGERVYKIEGWQR